MAAWIGCVGKFSASAFAGRIGWQCLRGENYALAVDNTGGERATLDIQNDGSVRAEIGNATEAGCSATISQSPNGVSVTLACDPFGLHGVWLVGQSGATWFASDIEQLRRFTQREEIIEPNAVHGYLCFGYVPTPHTLWTDICALPAGSVWTEGAARTTLFPMHAAGLWAERHPFLTDQPAAVLTLRRLLQEATLRQLRGLREVGVFLSGGLDSSLVAALLAEQGVRVHLFSLDFGEPHNAELVHAQTVAAHLKRPLHVVSARAKDIARALRPTAHAMQQPFGDPVCTPLYLLGSAASQHTDTVFTGEFGDQLFGGWANKPMIAAELYGSADYNRESAYLATFHRFHRLTQEIYSPAYRHLHAESDIGKWIRPALEHGQFSSLLHRLRAANLLLKGAQNIAPRSRQLAQACGLQVRSPFCDRALADWTFSCPPEWFLHGAQEKFLLKQVAEQYLPPEIVWREKRGMGVPVTEWCAGGLRRPIARILNPRRLKRDNRFRPDAVRTLCKGSDFPHEFRRRRLGERLWMLLMLHVWQDVHQGN
jgi:asparagine synthase (glutamine-hydrolysing)